jgi:hypothetical protein
MVDRAIEAAGLAPVLEARRARRPLGELATRLAGADLLALGALADRIRGEEVGDAVRIFLDDAADAREPGLVLVAPREGEATGLDLLRSVAVSRIAGAHAANIRVDWGACGLELAQVALGFGANELCGRISSKRGLPIAPGELVGVGKKSKRELAHLVKRKELGGFVERAGRTPVFVEPAGHGEGADAGSMAQELA